MAGINWDSILKKAERVMGTPGKKRAVEDVVDKVILGKATLEMSRGSASSATPEEAADKFIELFRRELLNHADGSYESGKLGPTAIQALSDLRYGTPRKVGNKYHIDVFFMGNLSRPSLAPSKYSGVENIAALLNSGYTAGHRVYGVWNRTGVMDERIGSLVSRGGAHFMQNARDDFLGNYGYEYGVEDIIISDTYE